VAQGVPTNEIADILAALRGGDASAMDRLLPVVYGELRRRARRQLGRGGRSATLDTSGLVHETYLKLVGSSAVWEDQHHFFAVAAKAMRSVIVDYARKRTAKKRGGPRHPITLEEGMLRVERDAAEILSVHQALERLAAVDRRLVELVELRFFAGLSVEETAQLLQVSDRTVKRDWTKARTLLYQLLNETK
jgi:RNA polymerase sigma factor (TIGR02999 family)